MNLADLLSLDGSTLVAVSAWLLCMAWAGYLRRWRLACAFACLVISALIRNPDGPLMQKMLVIALSALAVMLLMVDVRRHVRRRPHDTDRRG